MNENEQAPVATAPEEAPRAPAAPPREALYPDENPAPAGTQPGLPVPEQKPPFTASVPEFWAALAMYALAWIWFYLDEPAWLCVIVAGFTGLIVRVVKNVFQQAIAMKDELDLTV